jgi:hypothetical protein
LTEIISFQDAIKRTEKNDRAILIGNGFSADYFRYRTLLEQSGLDPNGPLVALFKALDTSDFELTIKALEDAAIVERSYGDEERHNRFVADANTLREALVHAIRSTHPAHREDIAGKIPGCIQFLKPFGQVFTLNYDLLLYWVILGAVGFSDGFGLGTEAAGFRGPFKSGAYCNVYNLHGGLHLYLTADGEVEKRLMGPSGVIDAIASTITAAKRLPIYVAEGTSTAKMRRINSNQYLSHCYEQLRNRNGSFFVYGHSAAENDAHIYRAIFGSGVRELAT